MRLLSATIMPRGVVYRTPREALPIQLRTSWVSLSMFLEPSQVSSEAYSIVPLTMACCRFRAEAGERPCLVTNLLNAASLARALFMDLLRLSLRVRAESSQTPSHPVAS